MAQSAVGAGTRRHPRRRHGPRQDPAGPRHDPARQGGRRPRRPAARRRPDQRARHLGRGSGEVHPGTAGRGRSGDVGKASGAARRGGGGRRHRHHDVCDPADRRGRVRGTSLAGTRARRGPVRQEPHGQDVPMRAPDRGPLQAGHDRDSTGELAHGPVVAALYRRAGPLRQPRPVHGDLSPAHRERIGARPARHAPAPDPAVDAAPDQGHGRRRSAPPSRSKRSPWSWPRPTASSTTRICSGSASGCSGSSTTTSRATASRSCAH